MKRRTALVLAGVLATVASFAGISAIQATPASADYITGCTEGSFTDCQEFIAAILRSALDNPAIPPSLRDLLLQFPGFFPASSTSNVTPPDFRLRSTLSQPTVASTQTPSLLLPAVIPSATRTLSPTQFASPTIRNVRSTAPRLSSSALQPAQIRFLNVAESATPTPSSPLSATDTAEMAALGLAIVAGSVVTVRRRSTS